VETIDQITVISLITGRRRGMRIFAIGHWRIAHRASNAHHCENPITVGAWAQKEACDRKENLSRRHRT
jgi:hypothetical protein